MLSGWFYCKYSSRKSITKIILQVVNHEIVVNFKCYLEWSDVLEIHFGGQIWNQGYQIVCYTYFNTLKIRVFLDQSNEFRGIKSAGT